MAGFNYDAPYLQRQALDPRILEAASRDGMSGLSDRIGLLTRERDAKTAREAETARVQGNADRSFGLQEGNAARQAKQDEYNMLMKSAEMGSQADRDVLTAANRAQSLSNQATRDAATDKYRRDVMGQQDKVYNDTQNQKQANIDLFNSMAGVGKTTTQGALSGNDSNVSIAKRNILDAGNMPMEVQQAIMAEAEAADNVEVKNTRYDEQIKDILSRSGADVATRNILGKMIAGNKPDATPTQKHAASIMEKYGVDVDTAEGKKFISDLQKKAVARSGYKGSKKSNSSYLLKEMEAFTATDDPIESNRKLIEMLPDIEAYADKKGISFKDAVEELKVQTAKNPGLISLWDQDVERGGQALLDINY